MIQETEIRRLRSFSVGALLAFAAIAFVPGTAVSQVEPGMGGNVGTMRTAAAVYRAHVRNVLASLLGNLGGLWDDSNPAQPSAFYAQNGNIVLGPDEILQGRAKIRTAFAGKLGRMRGVHMTMDEFDLSDELAFVRGTMSYELIHAGTTATRETAAFAMILRVKRDEWLIQTHVIGGKPILQDEPASGKSP